jgi:purine-binding chemotaxis protein CheW
VDKIDKVVGINSDTIQPPHPIFGDINIKFISGVVEKSGDLYIILDVVRIFSQNEEDKQKPRIADTSGGDYYVPPAVLDSAPAQAAAPGGTDESALVFIRESLFALRHFSAAALNETWLRGRFAEWSADRTGPDAQLGNISDADAFLAPFYSPCTGTFWDDDYAAAVKGCLPDLSSNNIQVWNIGCGKGYETFSFACILKERYPDGHIKIWANDSDIMAISQAPNMIFDLEELPGYCQNFMVKGKSGYSFNPVIKDSIVFEYHDILNDNPLPDLDMILARDVLSFFQIQDQERIIAGFLERLKNRGMVILGRNEELAGTEWRSMARDPVSAYFHS